MSQSILQNGYAILLSNTSDLDKHLLAKDQLLNRLTNIKAKKIETRDAAIASRQAQIDRIDIFIAKGLIDGTSTDTIDKYMELKNQLEIQISRMRLQNINATSDNIRETHSLFINTTFKPIVSIAYGYSEVGTTPLPLFGSSTRIKIPIYGDFIADQALHIQLSELRTVHKNNRIRWFDFIGHRLIREVRLVMDGAVLDRYGTEEMEMHYRFHVSENQKMGWMKCVGQETPRVGMFLQDPEHQFVREKKLLYDGPQTFKQTHEPIDLYIPLIFWYNLDPAFALSNWNITYEKFWIEIDFAPVEDCVSAADYAGDGGKYVEPSIQMCNLVTNHVYTTPEVADLFRHHTQFSIIRVHKRIERILNKPFDMINISDIKYAVENLYVRFRPVSNETNMNRSEIWRYNDVSTYTEIKYAAIISNAGVTSLASTPVYYYKTSPAIDAMSVICNGSSIYDVNPGVFYNAYIPMRFGGDRIVAPMDEGAYLLTFSLFPGKSQPSGYINFSQSREHYITYQSSYISTDTPATVVICAKSINFLILSPGSLSLRYAS
jgi:hypothetical protein